ALARIRTPIRSELATHSKSTRSCRCLPPQAASGRRLDTTVGPAARYPGNAPLRPLSRRSAFRVRNWIRACLIIACPARTADELDLGVAPSREVQHGHGRQAEQNGYSQFYTELGLPVLPPP